MIKSFVDKSTLAVFQGYFVRGLPRDIQSRALNKMRQLDAARVLEDTYSTGKSFGTIVRGSCRSMECSRQSAVAHMFSLGRWQRLRG